MPRAALLALPSAIPAALRMLRNPLAPRAALTVPGVDDPHTATPSMFDPTGASGLTVDVEETGHGASILAAHLASSPEVASMLILDATGLWAPGLMYALADVTGSPLDRLRLHSRSGLQVRAVVDETLLPAGIGPHRLVRSLHAGHRLAERRELLAVLLNHSQVCAVLVGPMPQLDAHALVDDALRMARLAGAEGVRWMFYLGADQHYLQRRIEAMPWPLAPRILHARGRGRQVSDVWNGLYAAWLES